MLQTDFSFTTMSPWCFYVCISGGAFTKDQISFMKRKNTEAYLLSFITNARNIMTNKRLRNDGIHLEITHCHPDNLNLIAKAK